MAKTPSSRKAKGRKLQNEIREVLLENFPELHPDEIKCAIMGENGVDLHISPRARTQINYSIEAKNTEKLNIWSAIKQAEENVVDGTQPMVVFRRNYSKTYAVVEFSHLVELLAKLSGALTSKE